MQNCRFLLAFILMLPLFPLNASQKINQEYLVLNSIFSNPGFFSAFLTVVGALDYCEEKDFAGLIVQFNEGIYYDEAVGSNWWEYYFEQPCQPYNPSFSLKHIKNFNLIKIAHRVTNHISKERCNLLINKYIKIKTPILEKVNQFVEEHFINSYVIGVHYRGTDKLIAEAKRVPYEVVLNTILSKASEAHNADIQVFVATDEVGFLNYLQENLPYPLIYTEAARSSNNSPVHYGNQYFSNYQKGEDALIDCLLLSKCNQLIRTVSNLSYVAERLNLEMPVTVIE